MSGTETLAASRFKGILKFLAIALPILFAYSQYLESNIQTGVDRAEETFAGAAQQLEARSEAVRSAGIRSLYSIAFRKIYAEPEARWYWPFGNIAHLWGDKEEYRILNRARLLFHEYAKAERSISARPYDRLSSVIAETALDWISRENELGLHKPSEPAVWFFHQANLPKAYLTSANFDGLVLSQANFANSNLTASSFVGTDLPRVDFSESRMRSAIMEGARLHRASLQNADLSFCRCNNADFTGANITNAEFRLSRLRGAIADKVVGQNASFQSSQLQNASFKNAGLSGANFAEANLRLTDFTGADLRGADFSRALELSNVRSWRHAQLDDAKFPTGFVPDTGTLSDHIKEVPK